MGVRINTSKTFKTTVKFNLHLENGKVEEQSFTAEFKRLSRDEVQALIDDKIGDREMVKAVMVGWKLIDGDTKEDVPFNDETLAAFFNIPGTAGVTLLAFLESVGASRQKN